MNEQTTNHDIELPAKGGTAIQVHDAPRISDPDMRMLDMIERAAGDPSVDVVKMRALMEMKRDWDALQASRAFDIAMNAAQQGMEQVRTDADNSQTQSRYASYSALDKAIRPAYTKHGFSISYNTREDAPADHVRITARCSRGGHSREFLLDIPADGKGARGGDVMTKTHAAMAALTYGKRGLLGMIFNITVARDDDGNSAGTTCIDEEQQKALTELVAASGAEMTKVLAKVKVKSIEQIPAKKFESLLRSLKQWHEEQLRKEKGSK